MAFNLRDWEWNTVISGFWDDGASSSELVFEWIRYTRNQIIKMEDHFAGMYAVDIGNNGPATRQEKFRDAQR
eukprot:scaffold496074_cov48-Prasinocladus_malaysianus.AAC.1